MTTPFLDLIPAERRNQADTQNPFDDLVPTRLPPAVVTAELPSSPPSPFRMPPAVVTPPVFGRAPGGSLAAALPKATEYRVPPTVVNAPPPQPDFSDIASGSSTRGTPSRDTARAYLKHGHPVVDTERRDAAGHVPTHRLDQPSGRREGETWEQYEDRVLARRDFGPDTAVVRDTGALEPDVRTKADSLIDAARQAGHRLEVGETRRTQDRQEMLFQRGRSRPGDVSTWTLTSDHTPGRALDFVVNGDTSGRDPGYQWLQENAPRFGFSVMGSMDPGHVAAPLPVDNHPVRRPLLEPTSVMATAPRMPERQRFRVVPPVQPDELEGAPLDRRGGIGRAPAARTDNSFSSRLANALAGMALHPEQVVEAPLNAVATLRDFATQKALGGIADENEQQILQRTLPNPSAREAVNAGAQLAVLPIASRAGGALADALAPTAFEGATLPASTALKAVGARTAGRAVTGAAIGTVYAPDDPRVGAALGGVLGGAEGLAEGKGTVRRYQSPFTESEDVTRQIGTGPKPRPAQPKVSVTGRVLDAPDYPNTADFEVSDPFADLTPQEPTGAQMASVGVAPKGFGPRTPKPSSEPEAPLAATPEQVATEAHPSSEAARASARPAPRDMEIPGVMASQRPVEAPEGEQVPSVARESEAQPARQTAPVANPFADLVEETQSEPGKLESREDLHRTETQPEKEGPAPLPTLSANEPDEVPEHESPFEDLVPPVAQPEETPQTTAQEAANAQPVRSRVPEELGGEPPGGVPTPRAGRTTASRSRGSGPPSERAVSGHAGAAPEAAPGPGGIDRTGAAPERAGEPGEGVGAGRGAGEVAGERGSGEPAPGSEPRATRPRERASAPEGKNYQLTDADNIGAGGPKAKASANLAAIDKLKEIESAGRPATPEEQQILAKYTGWGGLPQVFEPGHKDFGELGETLRGRLTREEYEAARASTLNAHYTHPEVVKQVHGALRRLGFDGGKILEPSAGVGNFLGFTPSERASKYRWTAVELDSITGRIAKLLYPEADVRVHGFEKLKVPDGTYDAAIGNVPFGDYKLADKRYDKLKLSIHDYFFVKSLDLVRPGGIVAYITSRYTMDRGDARVRNAILERGDLVGAVRLPTGAFRGNAGTDVVTDLIILRKKGAGDPAHVVPAESWQKIVNAPIDGIGTNINRYFAEHPDMVIGTAKLGRGMYGPNEYEVHAPKDLDVAKALGDRIAKLPSAYVPPKIDVPATRGEAELPQLKEAPDDVRDGTLIAAKDGIYRVENGKQVKASVPKTQEPVVRKLVAIRDQYKEVLRTQLEDASDAEITAARQKLNKQYDAFVKEHGPINLEKRIETSRLNAQGQPIVQTRYPNLAAFDDPEWPLVASIEHYDPESGKASKADALTRRILEPRRRVEKADTPSDALPIVLAESGRVDLQRIAQLSGVTPEDARAALRGAIYEDPEEQGTYRTATQYLSGNVRRKLALAKAAAKADPVRWSENVKALAENQPEDLPPSKISAKLGAPWVPKEDLIAFVRETFGAGDVQIFHLPSEATWKVKADWRQHSSFAATEEYGTRRAPGPELLEDALNLKTPWVYDRMSDGHGGSTSVKNLDESLAAQEKQQKLKDRFAQWVWEEPKRAERLARLYNDTFNNTRIPSFDGRHLSLPGAATHVNGRPFQLAKHQTDAIWRILENGNTLLAHVVGAGKTYTMVAAGMEAKRMGIARKPMYVVPNHMLEQFSREFKQLYPTAKILVASKDDFAKERRKEFVARAASHEWDAIIMTHRSHEAIAMSPDFQQRYLQEEMAALEESLREAKRAREQTLVKMIEKAKKRREDKLVKLLAESKKDDLLTFEQLGADMLFVDEAHLFKNLELRTKLEGVSSPSSERAFDLYMKTRYLDQQNPGRNIVFATGTPISNAIAEIFTMQRYLQPRILAERGVSQFDDWAATFGEPVTAMELAPDGSGYRAKTRFAKYQNVGELAQMFRSVADVKTTEDLNLPRPKLKGGQMEMVSAPTTGPLKAYVMSLVERARKVKEKKVDPSEDNFLRITTDGRHAALDMRLVDASAVDEPHSKLNQAVDRIHEIWKRTKDLRGAQLVFSDLSAPGSDPSRVRGGLRDFNIYDDVRKKLVARGIPEKEVRFMHEADTDEKKRKMFADVRAGRVRVLIGSTEKMGAGTNVQDRLVALHHLDAPWRPADIEQRNGRILRQGNQLYNDEKIPHVEINAYVTEGSFDAYIWQTLERKADFIRQAMTADASTREMEDIGAVEVDFATAKAIASGNPKVKEKADIDVQVQRLERLERQHRDEQFRVQRELKALPSEVEQLRKEVKSLRADTQRAEDTTGDKFKVAINGTTIGERGAAGEMLRPEVGGAAIGANALKIGEEKDTRIGTFAGFDLAVVGRRTLTGSIETWLKLIGEENHYREVSPNDSPASLVAQLESMPRLIEKLEAAKAEKLQSAEQRLAKLQEKGLSQFKDAEKLTQLRKRQSELSKELEEDAKSAEQKAREAHSEPVGSMTDLHSFTDPISAAIKMWKQASRLREQRLAAERPVAAYVFPRADWGAAAVRLPDGRYFAGSDHANALIEAATKHGVPEEMFWDNYEMEFKRGVQFGYVSDRNGRFIPRRQAEGYAHGVLDPFTAIAKSYQAWRATRVKAKAAAGVQSALNPASANVGKHRAALQYIFNPSALSDQAARMGRIKREALAEMAMRNERAYHAIEQLREAIDKLPAHIDPKLKDFKGPRWQWAFRMERGQAQPTPAEADAARVIRGLLDAARGDVQRYGKLQTWIEDYFPHIWSDKKKAQSFIERMLGRRPLEGPKSFLKRRSIDELEDGINAGLTPISENPLDMVLVKLREMHKYIAAQKIFREGRQAGLLKFVRPSKKLPTGWKYIEDPMATVYAQRGSQGEIRIRGRYAAPEPVARIINGYLAPGLRGNALYDSYMHAGNILNLVQLGLGAFHAGFVAFDATVSLGALGLEELLTPGRRAIGAKHFSESLISAALGPLTGVPITAPVATYIKGRKVVSAYMNGALTAEMQQIVDGLIEGGGRMRMDPFYEMGFIPQFRKALRSKQWAETVFAAPFAAIELAMKPLLEHVVPRMKLGAFYTLWQHELAKLPSGATTDEVRKAAAKAWDSIDNRLGQIVYDNLDWHRVTKDILMGVMRSVGWNLGTFREIGGGAYDAAHLRGSHRLAYVIMLAAVVALYGAVYTLLHTGELPKGIKDLYFPRTGEKDPEGNDERISPPTYVKDVVQIVRHPVTTLTHKMHPLLSMLGEMLQNRDFMGDKIYNEHDPIVTRGLQIMQAIEEEGRPFSFQNIKELHRRGQSVGTMAQAFIGLSPAPREIVRSPAEQLLSEYLGERGGGRTPEQKETSQRRRELREQVKAGVADVGGTIRAGELTKRQAIEAAKEAHKPSLVNRFQRLAAEEAIEVYRAADPAQRKVLLPYLKLKRARALMNGVPADRLQIPQ